MLTFFGLELWGVAYGQRTPDHAFGFQMFNESSRLTIHLKREVKTKRGKALVPVDNGRWQAPDESGAQRQYRWQDRVTDVGVRTLDVSVHAAYGLDAQLFRLQAALDDVASHIPDDTRTLALVADVETLRNGVAGSVRLRAAKP
ncbi:MAG TPA: hypothetical protein VHB79_21470 [Polyangiaceae bacterium]|nr:hypothetical protein [Polyangiaceae bacterium]